MGVVTCMIVVVAIETEGLYRLLMTLRVRGREDESE